MDSIIKQMPWKKVIFLTLFGGLALSFISGAFYTIKDFPYSSIAAICGFFVGGFLGAFGVGYIKTWFRLRKTNE